MKRYHMYIEWDELNGDYAKETESPDGEWVKYEDAQKLESDITRLLNIIDNLPDESKSTIPIEDLGFVDELLYEVE